MKIKTIEELNKELEKYNTKVEVTETIHKHLQVLTIRWKQNWIGEVTINQNDKDYEMELLSNHYPGTTNDEKENVNITINMVREYAKNAISYEDITMNVDHEYTAIDLLGKRLKENGLDAEVTEIGKSYEIEIYVERAKDYKSSIAFARVDARGTPIQIDLSIYSFSGQSAVKEYERKTIANIIYQFAKNLKYERL